MAQMTLMSVLLSMAVAGGPEAKAEPVKTHQVRLNGHTFTLPAGFEIEQVAGPPLVNRPIEADFDEQGRLYVSDSSGSNENLQIQLQKKPHRVVRLVDTRGNGHFDTATTFADKLNFPEGVMWYAGSLYVSAVPSIWKLTDKDGDGVADERVEWFKGKTMTGCGNDLHGPYLGPDGWIYWCKGAFAKQTYERPGKPPFVTRASHIFRCRPDGTGLEPVMTGGMDNPVGLAFTPGGERIFSTTFLQHPGGGHRDGLIHAVYGGVYGKDHEVIYDHPWTGPTLMPPMTHLGAAAPCGLIRYESHIFGPEYQDNLFACLFNMHKVTRHVLVPDGATFKTRDYDFLVSDNLDFHPTDVLEDADGSLLVIDTGGWYKLCCPTSQLHKPDILGAVYRVRRSGVGPVEDPRGLKLAWSKLTPKELARLLGDPRPAVRRRATHVLGGMGSIGVPELESILLSQDSSVEARRNAVWTATHINALDARLAVRRALYDNDPTVRQAALHSISLCRDKEAASFVFSLIFNDRAGQRRLEQLPLVLKPPLQLKISPQNARAAAEALGRIEADNFSTVLLVIIDDSADRVLEHSMIYAVIEGATAETVTRVLSSAEKSPSVHRAMLIALDQMRSSKLTADMVAKELTSEDARLREAAWWIAGHHPEWGGALAGFLREQLAANNLKPVEREELVHHLARFAGTAAIQNLLMERLKDSTSALESRRLALRAMAQSRLKEAPSAWIAAVTHTLGSDDKELVSEAVATTRALSITKPKADQLIPQLLKVAGNESLPINVRLSALAAIPGGLSEVQPATLTLLRAQLNQEQPVATRALAAEVLSHAKLNADQLVSLTDAFKTISPMEMDRVLEAFAQSSDERVGHGLIAALKASPARTTLRVEMVKPRLAKFSAAVQKEAEDLYAVINVDAAKQKARLEELVAHLKGGDIRRGQAVFHSTKASCSACHAVGYLGGTVGPDLTKIGGIRSERDLLESIVFPSASFVRSYEPVVVVTKSGKFINGLIRKDAPEEIVLATGVNQEARIARADIEEIQPSKVSVMPSGLDQQLSRQELADLVAFLKACK